jgi:RsiW-degrading membrane proteinase PrsW (M82 family)
MIVVLPAVDRAVAASTGMAAHANDAILSLYTKGFGQSWASDWAAGLTAPFTEELAKGAGLLLLIALAPRLVSTAFDGFILGAFIGLGFQLVEDVQHALDSSVDQFGGNPVQNSATTIVLRMITGFASHILFSSVFCAGLVYFLGRPGEPRRLGRGLTLMLTAMALHGLWDDTGGFIGAHTSAYIPVAALLTVLAVVVVTRVFALTVPRERAYMRASWRPSRPAG